MVATSLVVASPTVSAQTSACTWQVQSAPNVRRGHTYFTSIDGAAEDLWITGVKERRSRSAKTLVRHLTTDGWKMVPSPNRGNGDNELNDVVYLAPDDVWAVGASQAGTGSRYLVTHWDGTSWTLGEKIRTGREHEGLARIAAAPASELPVDQLAPRQLWAVGTSADAGFGNERGEVLHYDGVTWSPQELPAIGSPFALTGVDVISPTDVWAVGAAELATSSEPVALHYDGTVWSRVPTPNPGALEGGTQLTSVVAASTDDVWAVGIGGGGPVAMHFNGTDWTVVDTPALQTDRFGGHLAATIDETGEVWAAGVQISGTTLSNLRFHSLIQHGSVNGWNSSPAPNPGHQNALVGIRAIPGGAKWVVGFRTPKDGRTKNLLARCG